MGRVPGSPCGWLSVGCGQQEIRGRDREGRPHSHLLWAHFWQCWTLHDLLRLQLMGRSLGNATSPPCPFGPSVVMGPH